MMTAIEALLVWIAASVLVGCALGYIIREMGR